jgi:hypothetical protein
MDIAEHARNITGSLALIDRNVIAEAGTVFARARKRRHGHEKKQGNSEEQSTHGKPRGQIVEQV